MNKTAIVLVSALAAATAQADYVVKNNGEVIDVPEGYRVVFVEKGASIKKLYTANNVKKVKAKIPTVIPESEAIECTPDGDLTTGAPTCDE